MDSSDRKRRWDDAPAPASAPGASSSAPTSNAAAAAQAAAIAARIAASLRPGVQGNELMTVNKPDEGFVKDIEINDLRNRYLLTKGPTQKQVSWRFIFFNGFSSDFPFRLSSFKCSSGSCPFKSWGHG